MGKKIIFCDCGGTLLKKDFKAEILESFKQEKVAYTLVSDLCGLCVTQKEDIEDLMSSSEEILVIACRPRAVRLLLRNSGIDTEFSKIHFAGFLGQNIEYLHGEISNFRDHENNADSPDEIKVLSEWPAWYPLIDDFRCSSCGQCADFCLFGVFEKKDNKVQVVNPQGCKNNCPACARICPETAIIFPKYEHGGAIAGDESINEIEELQRQQKDIDEILGSEIYQALEKRKLKRQSIIRNSAMQEAIKDREKAINENKKK